jgi:ankyrin repeat protein
MEDEYMRAIDSNDPETFEGPLDQCGPNLRFKDNLSALHYAIAGCRPEIVRMIVAHPSVDINSETNRFTTPLLLACSIPLETPERLEIIMILLAHQGCNANGSEASTSTPLTVAIFNHDIEVADLLLRNPSIDPNCRTRGMTPLYMAVHYLAMFPKRDSKMVELILGHPRCNPNEVSMDNCSTPLHLAVYIKNASVIKMLAGNHKVSSAKRNKEGHTAFDMSKEQWITDLLLKSHIDRVNQLAKLRQSFDPNLKIVPIPSTSSTVSNSWFALRG